MRKFIFLSFLFMHRLTHGVRARQKRKTKPKGNHLKNLSNRIELRNEYEQHTVVEDLPSNETNRNADNNNKSIIL